MPVWKRILCPGDQTGQEPLALSKRRGCPPAALTFQIRLVSPSYEPKAISFQSGDQAGPKFQEFMNVTWRGVPPSAGTTKMSIVPLSLPVCP